MNYSAENTDEHSKPISLVMLSLSSDKTAIIQSLREASSDATANITDHVDEFLRALRTGGYDLGSVLYRLDPSSLDHLLMHSHSTPIVFPTGSEILVTVSTSETKAENIITYSVQRARQKRRNRQTLGKMKRRVSHLKQLSLKDPLTEVLNRRGLERAIHAEVSRAKRYGAHLGGVVIDIDHFKSINDEFGHLVGDQVLMQFSRLLQESCRESDIVGRLGGEEFCVLLQESNIHTAMDWAEKVRQSVADCTFTGAAKAIRLTASFGVTSLADADEAEDLLRRADEGVLLSKGAGRNSVTAVDFNSLVERKTNLRSDTIVQRLFESLVLRDPSTGAHSKRVSNYSGKLAEFVGLRQNDVWLARSAGLLHDVGKIGVPNAILHKPAKLVEKERWLMQSAWVGTYDAVVSAFGNGPLADTVRDARRPITGDYPPTVAGRIVAIADAFDSMTMEHSYRPPFSSAQALEELERCSGSQFDTALVSAFADVVQGKSSL